VTRAQLILIGSTIVGSWLGMQAVHEAGHVLGARLTGGRVERVVLHPLTISRTDLAENPQPLVVAWAGPVFGAIAPVLLWAAVRLLRMSGAFVLRFFAGFCLLANGLYIGVGSFDQIGDCGDLLRHGSPIWHLWLFGAVTAPIGLSLWHRQGPHFGLGKANGHVKAGVAYAALIACLALLLGFVVGGE
jgi:Peptidase M50B-like